MKRLTAIAAVKKCVASIGLIAVVALVGATAAAAAAKATLLCVGGQHCYPTLQAAVTAAHDGDTIQLKAGTYAGGVTIGTSVRIVGAAAQVTTIRGGGPGAHDRDVSGHEHADRLNQRRHDHRRLQQHPAEHPGRLRGRHLDPGRSEPVDRRHGDHLGQRHHRQHGHAVRRLPAGRLLRRNAVCIVTGGGVDNGGTLR